MSGALKGSWNLANGSIPTEVWLDCLTKIKFFSSPNPQEKVHLNLFFGSPKSEKKQIAEEIFQEGGNVESATLFLGKFTLKQNHPRRTTGNR